MLYKNPQLGQKILHQGSDIGIHTFTHHTVGNDGKINKIRFMYELDFTEKIFAHNYGFKTNLFRVPYQSTENNPAYYSLQYIREAYVRGLAISVPTVDSADWESKNEQEIVKNSTSPDVMGAVILLHDSGGNRSTTVKALPEIIKFYKEKGYEFITVSKLAKEYNIATKKSLTLKDKIFLPVSYTAYDIYKKTPELFKKILRWGLFLVIIHMFIFILLAILQVYQDRNFSYNRKKIKRRLSKRLISVIIPMYNEERSIKSVIRSVIKSTYKNLEIIVIDDGSTDRSCQRANEINDPRITIYSKPNGGKFSALNYGLGFAKGDITVCLDADTRVKPNAIRRIIAEFNDSKVAAIAGNIKVGNKRNFLTRIQSLEYVLAQSIEKRSLDLFLSVMVVPGAFGAWKTKKIKSLGGFSPMTLAEDFDLTLKLMKINCKVAFCDKAVAFTEAPNTIKQLFIQRRRWAFGNLQVLFEHKDMLFNKKYGALGMIFMPRTIFLQIPSVILTPVFDFLVIWNLIFGEKTLILAFIIFYLIFQLFFALIAYRLVREDLKDIILVPFLRFPYAQFLYAVFFESIFKAIKGEIRVWNKIKHSGRFAIAPGRTSSQKHYNLNFLNKTPASLNAFYLKLMDLKNYFI